jgi:SagB-type dehydrogenase family enzyme
VQFDSAQSNDEVARLYHLHSSNVRDREIDLRVDHDRRPLRFRTYAGSPRVALPGGDATCLESPLGAALMNRTSHREFARIPFPLATLGRLLYTSYGIRGTKTVDGQQAYDRPVPSAGGLYPLELYVATSQVEDTVDGIYHYDPRAHHLELLAAGAVGDRLADLTIGQDMLRSASIVVIISAVFDRTTWKYGERGYRYVWVEAGHIGQNLYLVTGALDLGAVAIGGFFDSEVNDLLALSADEAVIYMIAIGHPGGSI